MNEFSIREAGPRDAASLADLSARTFKSAYRSKLSERELDDYVAATFSLSRLQDELNDPACRFLIAHEGGMPVGYALLRDSDPPAGVTGPEPMELARIYLIEAVIGKGYGTALMEACLKAARENGHMTIWLGVWDANDRAIRFYEKWGFTVVGSLAFEFGDELQTDLVMSRPI